MNFFIRKDAFVSVGGFKQNYWPGEDSKLCELLVERNKQSIYYHPSLFVYHHRRATFKDFLIQHARYGFHRGAFFAHGDRNSRKIIYLMPSFFLLYILAFLISMLFIKIPIFAISPIALYGCILLMTSVVAYAKQNNILQSIIMVVLVSLIHITYGVYFIRGFIFPHQRLAL